MPRVLIRDGRTRTTGALGDYVAMDSLPSRAPVADAASNRLDPYYSHLWYAQNTALWTDRRTISSYIEGGIKPTQRMKTMTRRVNTHDFWHSARAGMAVQRSLASALMWRALTCDQMAALTGDAMWRGHTYNGAPNIGNRMVAAGVLQLGALPGAPGFSPPTMIRPGRFSSWDTLQRELSYAEWLAITAGQPTTRGASFAALKHSIALTEFGLRVAQWCPVVSVVGESLARHTTLVPALAEHPKPTTSAGDGVIITEDGRRVVIEMTVASINADEKVRRWIRTLQADTTRSTSVLFILAPGPGVSSNVGTRVRGQIVKALAESGDAGYDLSKQFYVGEWEEYFPRAGVVTSRFADLPVQSYNPKTRTWAWVNLLSDENLWWTPRTNADFDAAMTTAASMNMLLGTPHWLRDESLRPELSARLDRVTVAQAGFEHLPALPYARENRHDAPAPDYSGWMDAPSLFD